MSTLICTLVVHIMLEKNEIKKEKMKEKKERENEAKKEEKMKKERMEKRRERESDTERKVLEGMEILLIPNS